jgi:hypothetical protein
MFDLLQMPLSLRPNQLKKPCYLLSAGNLKWPKHVTPVSSTIISRNCAIDEVDCFHKYHKGHFTRLITLRNNCDLSQLALVALKARLVPRRTEALPLQLEQVNDPHHHAQATS